MNKASHKVYENLPDSVPVPARLRNRRAEVVIVPLPSGTTPSARRRRVLAAAWGSVKPSRSAARIDRDVEAMRAEWNHRP